MHKKSILMRDTLFPKWKVYALFPSIVSNEAPIGGGEAGECHDFNSGAPLHLARAIIQLQKL